MPCRLIWKAEAGKDEELISEGLKMMRKLWKRIEELSEEKQQTEAE